MKLALATAAHKDCVHGTAVVTAFHNEQPSSELRGVICERRLSIVANGVPLVNLLCSPWNLAELAWGFLYSEGFIDHAGHARSFMLDKDTMTATFELARPVDVSVCPTVSSGFGGTVLRSGAISAGYRGVNTRNLTTPGAGHPQRAAEIAREAWTALDAMGRRAVAYARTRGMHCSALLRNGELLACYEDIGRHNTFDKLAGWCLLEGVDPAGCLLATTGRVSGEMCAKALRLGVRSVASCSGPTDAALERARAAGMSLIGYAGKPGEAVVYESGREPTATDIAQLQAAL